MYRLAPPAWKHAAERFAVDPAAADGSATRPRSYEAQGDWVLERVLHGHDPVEDPDSKAKCADLDKVLARLWKKKLLRNGTRTLTAAGQEAHRSGAAAEPGEAAGAPALPDARGADGVGEPGGGGRGDLREALEAHAQGARAGNGGGGHRGARRGPVGSSTSW